MNEMRTELFSAIEQLKSDKLSDDDKEDLLTIFKYTNNPAIRNQIALIFSEVGYNKAIPVILKKIKEKDLYNRNGTLVYSLEGLDTLKYFVDVIKIICEQGYEARVMAYAVIEKTLPFISKQTKLRSLQILNLHLEKGLDSGDYENSKYHFMESIKKLLITKI